MTWNHRIIFHDEDGPAHAYYAIHECWYGRRGAKIPNSWTIDPVPILESDMESLSKSLQRMQEACTKPVLRITKDGKRLVEMKNGQKSR